MSYVIVDPPSPQTPCLGPCSNYACVVYGCSRARHQSNTPPTIRPVGCICPPTSEQTCQSDICPRKTKRGSL